MTDPSSPKLHWPGKPSREKVLRRIRYDATPPAKSSTFKNCLFHGDNFSVLTELVAVRASVDLIYIDPPFATDKTFPLRGDAADTAESSIAYRDTWDGGLAGYLTMFYERVVLMRELLTARGSLYVHLDANAVHYAKIILDEVFGPESFQREIVWRIGWISGFKSRAKNWIRNHDTILFYVKTPKDFVFHKHYTAHAPGYERRGGGEGPGYPVDDVWNANAAEAALSGSDSLDSIQIRSFSGEKTGFPTQKNESLLRRIILASSNPGDVVADFFCGSGTTLVVAEQLDRRWIGCDVSEEAIRIARDRLQSLPAVPFESRASCREHGFLK